MIFEVEGVSELVLEVKSMDRAIAFWSEKLGFPILEQWTYENGQFIRNKSKGLVWVSWLYVGGNTRLGLWLPRKFTNDEIAIKKSSISKWGDNALYDEGGKHVHFALYINPINFDKAVGKLKQLGVHTLIRNHDCSDENHSIYFKDTEDNVVEFYTKSMKKTYANNTNKKDD